MHKLAFNILTGEVTEVPFTPEEQAEYDAAIAQLPPTDEQTS
jgi:hypothetical protein